MDDVKHMRAHIEAQGNEEVLLQAQLESLQDRMSAEEQHARDEEPKLCQRILDDELKKRDQTHQALMKQRVD
eukprot:3050923-Prorocentrum_lima.AAC.1